MDRHSERFRNHISIVAEQLGRGLWFVGAVAVGGVVQNVREAVQLAQLGREAGGAVLQGLLVALVFLVILVAWQVLVWARTFISIDGTTLVIERNTLNRKVNTIGIGNISNVNTEQNLFEMLVGTCKIKLDTNSLSTADSTDVKIVLKKREAEVFCARITRIMEEMAGDSRWRRRRSRGWKLTVKRFHRRMSWKERKGRLLAPCWSMVSTRPALSPSGSCSCVFWAPE